MFPTAGRLAADEAGRIAAFVIINQIFRRARTGSQGGGGYAPAIALASLAGQCFTGSAATAAKNSIISGCLSAIVLFLCLIALDTVKRQDSKASVLARFVVEDGKPGPQRS
jgi:hypothetical protein